jgi:tripartite-type tricarboxylate transporter receptor subunit TctC
MLKRSLLTALLATLALPYAASVQAQQLPPLVRIVVPFAAGASTDVTARALAQQLQNRLGSTFIVENRPGASGMIGSATVVKGPKDGSQLLFTSVSMVSSAAATRNAPFDVVKDLTPVAIVNEAPLILVVNAKSDIKTPQDLINVARAKPEELTHGTGGVGTIAHLAMELFNEAAKVNVRHIPYKGAAPAVTDLAGDTLSAVMAVNSTFGPNIKSGRLRVIGVASEKAHPGYPGVPTLNTVAPGYSAILWTAVFAPAGTPAPLVQRLNKEIVEIAKSREFADLMQNDAAVPVAASPEEAARVVANSYNTWKKISSSRNIVLE